MTPTPIPFLKEIFQCNPVDPHGCLPNQLVPKITTANPPKFQSLGQLLSGTLNIVFIIAGFLAFFWLVWGTFEYIFAGGEKEKLAKARSRIMYAIVGLVLLALAFAVSQWFAQVLEPSGSTPISLIQTAYAAGAGATCIGPVNGRPDQPLNNCDPGLDCNLGTGVCEPPFSTPVKTFPCGPSSSLHPLCPTAVPIGTRYGFGNIPSLGEGVNKLIIPAFSIATTAVVIYFLVGGYNLITSSGDKEKVAAARAMITHAIIGFLLVMMLFVILQLVPQLFGIGINIF